MASSHLRLLCVPSSPSAVLTRANLVGLGIEVPQVLVPEHPSIIDGVAVGAVVVAVGRVFASVSVLIVPGLIRRGNWSILRYLII